MSLNLLLPWETWLSFAWEHGPFITMSLVRKLVEATEPWLQEVEVTQATLVCGDFRESARHGGVHAASFSVQPPSLPLRPSQGLVPHSSSASTRMRQVPEKSVAPEPSRWDHNIATICFPRCTFIY